MQAVVRRNLATRFDYGRHHRKQDAPRESPEGEPDDLQRGLGADFAHPRHASNIRLGECQHQGSFKLHPQVKRADELDDCLPDDYADQVLQYAERINILPALCSKGRHRES